MRRGSSESGSAAALALGADEDGNTEGLRSLRGDGEVRLVAGEDMAASKSLNASRNDGGTRAEAHLLRRPLGEDALL